jgi:hypothetical protein
MAGRQRERARFMAPWKDSTEQHVIYRCVSRVVGRRFAFGKEDKEQLRTYMRMYMKGLLQRFSGLDPPTGGPLRLRSWRPAP